jgi:hypothetical protein
VAHIRAGLDADGPDACGALALVVHLGLLREMEPAVLGLARASDDPRVRATAAGALARSATRESWAELERLVLGDADVRVRSNAIEAMGRRSLRDRRAGGRVHELAAEVERTDAHRLRSAALRARLLGGQSDADAVAALGAMLSDARAAHRAAGLWLAERAAPGSASGGWGQVAARIAEMACADADPGVRARAERCSRALMARLRSAWTVRVRELAPPAPLTAGVAV